MRYTNKPLIVFLAAILISCDDGFVTEIEYVGENTRDNYKLYDLRNTSTYKKIQATVLKTTEDRTDRTEIVPLNPGEIYRYLTYRDSIQIVGEVIIKE